MDEGRDHGRVSIERRAGSAIPGIPGANVKRTVWKEGNEFSSNERVRRKGEKDDEVAPDLVFVAFGVLKSQLHADYILSGLGVGSDEQFLPDQH